MCGVWCVMCGVWCVVCTVRYVTRVLPSVCLSRRVLYCEKGREKLNAVWWDNTKFNKIFGVNVGVAHTHTHTHTKGLSIKSQIIPSVPQSLAPEGCVVCTALTPSADIILFKTIRLLSVENNCYCLF